MRSSDSPVQTVTRQEYSDYSESDGKSARTRWAGGKTFEMIESSKTSGGGWHDLLIDRVKLDRGCPRPFAPRKGRPTTSVVTEKFNLLDVAGAWEVFNDAKRPKPGKKWEEGDRIFEVFLVSNTTEPIHSGVRR